VKKLFDIFNVTFMFLFGFICLYPFWTIIIYSFSDPKIVIGNMPLLLPVSFTLENYIQIFSQNDFVTPVMVSTSRTVLGTITSVLSCTMFAYSLTKSDKLPLAKIMSRMLVVSMFIGAGLIPTYVTYVSYGFRNNFLVYILPPMISVYNMILIIAFIKQLPSEMEECARIDGAGYGLTFFAIILPLVKPVLATVAVFVAVGQWNAWVDNLYYNTNPNLLTLQLVLSNFLTSQSYNLRDAILLQSTQGSTKITPMSIRMTITVIVTLPVMLVYPFMQKYFIKGIMLGAIKG